MEQDRLVWARQKLAAEALRQRPGYLFGVPYLWVLRVLVIGIAPLLAYSDPPGKFPAWQVSSEIAVAAFVVASVVAGRKNFLDRAQPIGYFAFDTALVFSLYSRGAGAGVDLLGLLALPLLDSVELLGDRLALMLCLASAGAVTAENWGAEFGVLVSRLVSLCFGVAIVVVVRVSREGGRWVGSGTQVNAIRAHGDRVAGLFEVGAILATTAEYTLEALGSAAVGVGTLSVGGDGSFGKPVIASPGAITEAMVLQLANAAKNEGNRFRIDDLRKHPAFGPVAHTGANWALVEPIADNKRVSGFLIIVGREGYAVRIAVGLAKAMTGQTARAIQRCRIMESLCVIGASISTAMSRDRETDAALYGLTRDCGFEFASVSLVDDFRQTIEMARGWNVPPGWRKKTRFRLNSKDVLAEVVSQRKPIEFSGWDERLSREIYERYGHERLLRRWIPIVFEGSVIGVLSAGCDRKVGERVMDDASRTRMELVAAQLAPLLAGARPHVLLKCIAEQAIDLIGANAASVHVDRNGEKLFLAGAGRADLEFLETFPRRYDAKAIGTEAIRTRKPLLANRTALKTRHPELYAHGVRSIGAFPLIVSNEVTGVLYVHFWEDHEFTLAEEQIEMVFAAQMEIAIRNALALTYGAEVDEHRTLHKSMQSIAASLSSDEAVSKALTECMLLVDADGAVCVRNPTGAHQASAPPLLAGRFRAPEAAALLGRGLKQVGLQLGTEPVYYDDADGIARLDEATGAWLKRESIRAAAILPLPVPVGDAGCGMVAFVYRSATTFSEEDRQLARTAVSALSALLQIEDRQHLDNWEPGALLSLERAITGHIPKLQDAIEPLLEEAVGRSSTVVAEVFRLDQTGRWMQVVAQWGGDTDRRGQRNSITSGITGLAATTRRVQLARDITDQPWDRIYRRMTPGTRSELAVPLTLGDELVGVINMESQVPGAFGEEDVERLRRLGMPMAVGISTLATVEGQVRLLRMESMVAMHIQDVRRSREQVARILLTAVTSAYGLAFSRALILVREDGVLRPLDALGSLTKEEEEEKSRQAEVRSGSATEMMDALDYALQAASPPSVEQGSPMRLAKALDWQASGVIGRVLATGGALEVLAADERDGGRDQMQRLDYTGEGHHCPLVCVPLRSGQTSFGVLLADNRYQDGEPYPEQAELDSLLILVDMAARAIDEPRIREATQSRLKSAQKELDDLREARVESLQRQAAAFASLGHELRNPLMLAKDYLLLSLDPEEEQRGLYGKAALGVLDRAGRVASNVGVFVESVAGTGGEESFVMAKYSELVTVLNSCIGSYVLTSPITGGVRFDTTCLQPAVNDQEVRMNSQLFDRVVSNILDNAQKYSDPETVVSVGSAFEDDTLIFWFRSQGIPVGEADAARATNRGWRGEEAQWITGEGAGMGLWMVKQILARFCGSVQLKATDEAGITEVKVVLKSGRSV